MQKSEFWRNFWRRRKQFIDRKQQTRFAFEILFIVILFPFLFYTLVIIPPFSTMLLGKSAESLSVLFENQLNMIGSVWWVVVFILVYIALLSVWMSHRIFGPIYRLSQAVKAKLRGEEKIHCKLRKGDYFVDFASELEQLINDNKNKPSNE
jgi:type II secretory pathway component PulF